MEKKFDPITLEIIQNSLQAASDEMFAALRRTAMSAIIYEVLDMGTGITDRNGEIASSGAGIPAFVGVLDKTVKKILEKYNKSGDIEPGDVFLTNDPYSGGVTHLNDVVLTMPVFFEGDIIAWTANIAHWNDVGGKVPGSMSNDATEIFQEGMIYPGVKVIVKGKPNRAVFDILTANGRMPDFLLGDLWAGIAAVRVGEKRLLDIAGKYGKETFLYAVEDFMDFGEQVSLNAISKFKKGRYELREEQDDGQFYNVTIDITDNEFLIDLRDNPPQSPGPFNMSLDDTIIACQMAFKNVLSPERTANGGSFRPMKVLTKKGTILDPEYPAAMGIYYELNVRIQDLLVRCLSERMQDELPAGNFSSVMGTLFGGIHPDTGRNYAVVEPELGGWGGSPTKDGEAGQFSALHGETFNCPAEIAESRYGVTVDYLSYHNDDGGAGKHRGGNGVRIDYRIRSDNAWLSVAYTRDRIPPWPLKGGNPGSSNHIVIRRKNGEQERYSTGAVSLNTDDVIQIMSATGAGWGDPKDRSPELVKKDVRNGYITPEQAKRDYGVDASA